MASVAFPASLKEIGGHAFEDCVALTEVDLSKTALQEISSDANTVFITIEQPKLIRNIRV